MRMDFRALFVLIALFISDKTKALPTIDIVDAYTSTKLSKNFFLLIEKKGTESSAEAIAKRDFPLVKQTATFFIEDSISPVNTFPSLIAAALSVFSECCTKS